MNERRIIWFLCLLAAVHVFIFSAAFPFFNNVDEQIHFDLVLKYTSGELPRRMEMESKETLRYIAVYGSPEFLFKPGFFMGEKYPPPPWTQPLDKIGPTLLENEARWNLPGYEFSQPPLYYVLAALWWKAGAWFGLQGGSLLYWLRFLNIFFVMAIAWIGYFAARQIFPGNSFLRLGVPALVAFIPQTSFYSIQNDPLSPLCFGALFYCLIRLLKAESPDVKLGILTGVAMTITCFAKLTNLPLLAMSALVIFFKMWQWIKAGKLRAALPMFISLAAFAGLSLFWFGWCKYHFGDYTGSEIKVKFLGWTHKPFNEWSNHPIFTVAGTWAFISKLMITFWQGEFWWHGLELNIPAINSIYVILSFSFVGLAVCGLFSRRTSKTLIQRQALWLCIFNFAAVIAFLGFLSILYDFNFCICPSREFPYFTAGRMILGALIPFILLFLYGIDYLFAGIQGDRIRFFALFGMIIFMVVSEIVTDWVVFFSDYNWYHM